MYCGTVRNIRTTKRNQVKKHCSLMSDEEKRFLSEILTETTNNYIYYSRHSFTKLHTYFGKKSSKNVLKMLI